MSKDKIELIRYAYKKFKNIKPCGTRESFAECFTSFENELLFWFDTDEGSTRMVRSGMKETEEIYEQ